MMKKIVCLTVTGLFVFGAVGFSWAMDMMCGGKMRTAQAQETQAATGEEKAVDTGNKICPVSGEKIDEKMKTTYEHEGKIYNFCCAMCVEDFKKDPEKYIKKVEEELAKEAKEPQEEPAQPQHMHQGHQH